MTHPTTDDQIAGDKDQVDAQPGNAGAKISIDQKPGLFGILMRIALPAVFLAGGFYAYQHLSIEVEKEAKEQAVKKMIKTRVAELHSRDYPVVIKKNGIVQPHN